MSKLKLKTFELLRKRPADMTLADVAKGSGLPLPWIKSFHIKGDTLSCNVDTVERLYEYLSKKELKV